MTRLLLATVLAASAIMTAEAEDFNGMALYQYCEHHDPDHVYESALCGFYVRGFLEGMLLGAGIGAKVFCPPEAGISAPQARLIIEKYMRENPKALNAQVGAVAGAALITAFPCKKPN
jgi:hypothetical protein